MWPENEVFANVRIQNQGSAVPVVVSNRDGSNVTLSDGQWVLPIYYSHQSPQTAASVSTMIVRGDDAWDVEIRMNIESVNRHVPSVLDRYAVEPAGAGRLTLPAVAFLTPRRPTRRGVMHQWLRIGSAYWANASDGAHLLYVGDCGQPSGESCHSS